MGTGGGGGGTGRTKVAGFIKVSSKIALSCTISLSSQRCQCGIEPAPVLNQTSCPLLFALSATLSATSTACLGSRPDLYSLWDGQTHSTVLNSTIVSYTNMSCMVIMFPFLLSKLLCVLKKCIYIYIHPKRPLILRIGRAGSDGTTQPVVIILEFW